MDENDLFERLMRLPLFRPVYPFWRRQREKLLYLFFGALTTLISLLVFWLCYAPLGMNELAANVVSWVLAVLFAYATNARWVFAARPKGGKDALRQLFAFMLGRLGTLGAEELILLVFVTWLRLPAMPVKIAAQILVIILNYIISKRLVFKKKD